MKTTTSKPDLAARVRLTVNAGEVKPGDIDFGYRTVATVTVHPSTMTPDQVSLGGTVGCKVTRTYTDGTSDESSTHFNTTVFR